jgi:hypothetical protein
VNLKQNELSAALTAFDCIVRSGQCLSTEIDDETVLMSVESGCYGGLDDIGSDIWRRLEKPISVVELCDGLASEYDANRATIEADVLAFLSGLLEKQMIEIVPR